VIANHAYCECYRGHHRRNRNRERNPFYELATGNRLLTPAFKHGFQSATGGISIVSWLDGGFYHARFTPGH